MKLFKDSSVFIIGGAEFELVNLDLDGIPNARS